MATRPIAALVTTALVGASSALLGAAPASAGSSPPPYPVTTTADVVDAGDGVLSLREAITTSNTDGDHSTVVLGSGLTYDLSLCGPADSQEDANANGDLDDTSIHVLHIDGHGSTIRNTCSGERVFDELGGNDLELFELTLTGGNGLGDGGGIRMQAIGADLIASQLTVSGNVSGDLGGGIHSVSGDITLVNSTVSDNVGGTVGGISGNNVSLLRSTVSHNRAEQSAGGIFSDEVALIDSTLMANRVQDGAGSNIVAGSLTSRSSIIALGSGAPNCAVSGLQGSGNDNLLSDGTCPDVNSRDQAGLHPQLGPLADNGGPTLTHRPAFGSPALDHIPTLSCFSANDQRGEVRPQPTAGSCDVGSVEEPAASCTPAAFPDVGTGHPFFSDICWMDQMGITTGFAGGQFRPSQNVSRQSMAAFLHRFAGAPPIALPTSATFSDVPPSHPFFTEIEWLADSEITGGFADGSYRPSTAVSRQAMAAFLFRIGGNFGFIAPVTPSFTDVGLDHPFFREIEWTASDAAVSQGFGDGTWRPSIAVSRQAMSAFLHRLAGVPFLQGL